MKRKGEKVEYALLYEGGSRLGMEGGTDWPLEEHNFDDLLMYYTSCVPESCSLSVDFALLSHQILCSLSRQHLPIKNSCERRGNRVRKIREGKTKEGVQKKETYHETKIGRNTYTLPKVTFFQYGKNHYLYLKEQ